MNTNPSRLDRSAGFAAGIAIVVLVLVLLALLAGYASHLADVFTFQMEANR
jgi:hypothetical protein